MKKLVLVTALILLLGSAFGQNLQKGNFVGLHVYTITLSPGVTMDQLIDSWNKNVNPTYEKVFQCKAYWLKGIRGECTDCIGGIVIWKSEADRDKFFKKEGGLNDAGNAAMAKVQPLIDQLNKLGTWTTKYTDWVVQ
jgi:hypothetical protein